MERDVSRKKDKDVVQEGLHSQEIFKSKWFLFCEQNSENTGIFFTEMTLFKAS